jgi:hypothetical protein
MYWNNDLPDGTNLDLLERWALVEQRSNTISLPCSPAFILSLIAAAKRARSASFALPRPSIVLVGQTWRYLNDDKRWAPNASRRVKVVDLGQAGETIALSGGPHHVTWVLRTELLEFYELVEEANG